MPGKTNILFITGTLLICFITFVMSLNALILMIGASVSWWTIPSSFLCSACLVWLCGQHALRSVLRASLLALIIVIAATAVSVFFIDCSYDGNMYHKLAVAFLADGWNPLISSINTWADYQALNLVGSDTELWIDHYPRGLWLFDAAFYDLTGTVEAGKSYTLIAMTACFCVFFWIARTRALRLWQAALIALFAAVNPITVVQFHTACNDGFLMMALFLLIGSLFGLAYPIQENGNLLKLIFTVSFIACAQTKFTGLAYAGVFSVAFLVVYLVLFIHNRTAERMRRFITMGLLMFVTLIIAIAIVGYSPYITNLMNNGNPLFPLAGEGAADIMTHNTPTALLGMGTLEQELASLFAVASDGNVEGIYDLQLKVPFSITLEELVALRTNDLRLNGFGVLNSGIAIINVLCLIPLLMVSYKRYPVFFACCIAYYLCVVFLLFALGDGWWARYSSYRYLSLIILLGFLFRCWDCGIRHITPYTLQCLSVILIGLIALNTAFFIAINTTMAVARSLFIHAQIEATASMLTDDDVLQIAAEKNHEGMVINLRDASIFYEINAEPPDETDNSSVIEIQHLTCRVVDAADPKTTL